MAPRLPKSVLSTNPKTWSMAERSSEPVPSAESGPKVRSRNGSTTSARRRS